MHNKDPYFFKMLCKELKDCVRCKAFGTGPMAINKCLNCELNVTIVPPEEVQGIDDPN